MLAHFFSTTVGRLSGPGALEDSRDVNSSATSSVITSNRSRGLLIRSRIYINFMECWTRRVICINRIEENVETIQPLTLSSKPQIWRFHIVKSKPVSRDLGITMPGSRLTGLRFFHVIAFTGTAR